MGFQMENELEKTLNDLEQEVMKEMDDNIMTYEEAVHFSNEEFDKDIMKTFKVDFKYTVKFTLEDDPHTEITISSKSREHYYARNKDEVFLQKGLSDTHVNISLPKYIIDHVEQNLYSVDLSTVELTHQGTPKVKEMTEEELLHFQKQIISANV
jgi:hypothetical protein